MFKQKSTESDEQHVFPFPLFTTCVHMLVQFGLAGSVLYFLPRYRPKHEPPTMDETGDLSSRSVMSRWFYISRIGPCGAATGLDIGLGNMSFRFITLTFYSTLFLFPNYSNHSALSFSSHAFIVSFC